MTSASSFSKPGTVRRETPADPPAAGQLDPELRALSPGKPPGDVNDYVLLGRAPEPGQPQLLVTWDTFQRLQAHCHSDTSSEVGGALLGKAYRYEGQIFVEVRASLPAQSSDHGPIHFTFNADSWSQLHKDRAQRHPELDIVGWFHTHPGLGVFFSGDDIVVHSAAFVLPWHVALVLDPLRGEMGLFAWQKGKIVPVPGFFGIVDEGAWRDVPWRFVPAEVWEDTYEERLRKRRAAAREKRRVADTVPGVNPWLGLLLGAVGLILSLGLLFGGVLPLSRQNDALQQFVLAQGERNLHQASVAGDATCPDPTLRIYVPQPGAEISELQATSVVGRADHPQASRYQLELRPLGEPAWWPLGQVRGAESPQALWNWDSGQWDASRLQEGTYELRLGALNEAGTPLEGSAPCVVRFDIAQAGTAE